jgi:hypothetical protein
MSLKAIATSMGHHEQNNHGLLYASPLYWQKVDAWAGYTAYNRAPRSPKEQYKGTSGGYSRPTQRGNYSPSVCIRGML